MQTNDRRAAWLVVLGLCLVPAAGCSSGECACLDCQTRSVTPVAWTDPTALGSPEAFPDEKGTEVEFFAEALKQ